MDVRGSMLVFRGALVKADGDLVKPEKELDVRGSMEVFIKKIFLQLRIGGCLHEKKVLIQAGDFWNEEGSPKEWPRA